MEMHIAHAMSDIPAQAAVVAPLFSGDATAPDGVLSDSQARALARLMERRTPVSNVYEKSLLIGSGEAPDVLVIGAGERSKLDALAASRLAGAAYLYLSPRKYPALAFVVSDALPAFELAYAYLDGSIRASSVGLSKSDDTSTEITDVYLVATNGASEALAQGAELGRIVGESRNIARELVNLPPNVINPGGLAKRAQRLAADTGLECEVLDQERMRELGMGSFLGVAAGSAQSPRLMAIRYGDSDAPIKLALVGKGLTFDSGGLSLKTHEGMETMKSDMSGAAAVIAGMVAISRLRPTGIQVTGYVGATENMPGGSAMRPGDILTAMNGTTIEVLNTDAEGRLVLADVLAYAVQQGANRIVDFATLTGAAMVSLGDAASLATGKPMDWVEEVVAAADEGLDRTWAMPQYREYRQAMDSDFADLKNTGGRGGGALNAAAFLSEFVGDVPWTHMDIAGTAFSREPKPYRPKGATGVGVGAIVALVRRLTGEA